MKCERCGHEQTPASSFDRLYRWVDAAGNLHVVDFKGLGDFLLGGSKHHLGGRLIFPDPEPPTRK